MGDVVHRERDGEIQVITDRNPGNLHRRACFRYCEKQNTADCKKRCGKEQPRTCFAVLGTGVIHEPAHDQIRDRVNDLGNDRKDSKEQPAPDRRQVQHIRIELVQIALSGDIEHAHDKRRAEKIPQPPLAVLHICGLQSCVEHLTAEQFIEIDDHGIPPAPLEPF